MTPRDESNTNEAAGDDPEERRMQEGKGDLEGQVREAADLYREVLGEAEREGNVDPSLERQLASLPLPGPGAPVTSSPPGSIAAGDLAKKPRLPWTRFAAVALFALLIGAWAGGLFDGDDAKNRGADFTPLGVGVQPISPVGEVDHVHEFTWNDPRPLPTGSSYRVEVLSLDGEVVLQSPPLKEARWTPADSIEWPSRYRWRVITRHSATDVETSRSVLVE